VLAHDSPGWLDAGTVTVVVYDADGNVTTRSDAISVSGYPFVPSIGAPTPAAASELGRLDSVSIPITDDAGIADVSCWVVYSSGERPEPVYEGGAACSSFDDTTALSGSSTSKTLIVARNAPGWLGDPTIHVSVKDLDGNVTTTSYAYTAEGYPYEPTLSASTPIAGSSLDSDDTVTFTITAPNTLDDVLVWLDYGAGGAEIAFWGTVAGGSALGSYVVDVTGDASEATLEISRTGGWRGPFDLRVEAVDLEGGQVSGTFAAFEAPVLYVDPTPPTVAAITSTASPRHRSDPLVLELEDTFSLAGALVLVKLPSGSWEGAYDGAEWAPRYASSALEVVSASLWRITLRRDGGWPVVGTPPTVDVCVRVFDTSGNLYTA
jgi:hypothetical protein